MNLPFHQVLGPSLLFPLTERPDPTLLLFLIVWFASAVVLPQIRLCQLQDSSEMLTVSCFKALLRGID